MPSHTRNFCNVQSSFQSWQVVQSLLKMHRNSKKDMLKLTPVLFMRGRRLFIKNYLDISSMLKGMIHDVTFCLLFTMKRLMCTSFLAIRLDSHCQELFYITTNQNIENTILMDFLFLMHCCKLSISIICDKTK